MKKSRIAGGVVLNSSGDVLVVQQKGSSWSLPKGHVERGEKALDAARREIGEEAGISQLEFKKKLGTYLRFKIGVGKDDDVGEEKTIAMYLFYTRESDLCPIDATITRAEWVSKEEVVSKLTHRKDKEFFRSITSQLN